MTNQLIYLVVKSRGPILTSSETCSVCVKQATAKFEYSLLIGQCRSLRLSPDTFFFIKSRLQLKSSPIYINHSICHLFLGDWSQSEKPSEIKPPLGAYCPDIYQYLPGNEPNFYNACFHRDIQGNDRDHSHFLICEKPSILQLFHSICL